MNLRGAKPLRSIMRKLPMKFIFVISAALVTAVFIIKDRSNNYGTEGDAICEGLFESTLSLGLESGDPITRNDARKIARNISFYLDENEGVMKDSLEEIMRWQLDVYEEDPSKDRTPAFILTDCITIFGSGFMKYISNFNDAINRENIKAGQRLDANYVASEIYGTYNNSLNCWVTESNSKKYCMKVESAFKLKDERRGRETLHVLATGQTVNEKNNYISTHSGGGVIGVFEVTKTGSEIDYYAIEKALPIETYGAPVIGWKFTKIGAHKWGWIGLSNNLRQGASERRYIIMTSINGEIKEIANIAAALESTEKCTDIECNKNSTTIKSRMAFLIPSKSSKDAVKSVFYDMVITIEGSNNGRLIPSQRHIIEYDFESDRYQQPPNWILDADHL